MIGLIRPPAPAVLTPAFVKAGVARFIRDGSAVWKVDEIKTALLAMSGGKCAYCELRLGEGAAYLEVEHFFAKDHHPRKVLDWTNLFPACRRCNGKKSDWDVALPGQMIVDPVLMAPATHIRLDEAYRPIGLTPEGKTAVVEIALDDILRLGVLRYKLGETFKRKLEELHVRYTTLPSEASIRQRRAVVRKVKEALTMCRRDQPFSAVMATVLARSADYAALKVAMITAGEWDAELRTDDATAAASSLA